jgi:hypothetical protein
MSYATMHHQLRKLLRPEIGRCSWEGDPYLEPCEGGIQIALRHDATEVLDDEVTGRRYSVNPNSYLLLCWGHHTQYDQEMRAVRRRLGKDWGNSGGNRP